MLHKYRSKEKTKEVTPKVDGKPEYNPQATYFLKVTPMEDETYNENIISELLKLKGENFPFGEFKNFVSNRYGCIKGEWATVEFFPKSKDLYPFACKYKTCEQALDAAIKHLNKAGLDAVPFDLEKLVNNIKIKPSFKNDKGLFVDYTN